MKWDKDGYTEAPPEIEESLARAKPIPDFLPPPDQMVFKKSPVTIRLDKEVVEWFKSQGPGYQTRINAVLRAYMEAYR